MAIQGTRQVAGYGVPACQSQLDTESINVNSARVRNLPFSLLTPLEHSRRPSGVQVLDSYGSQWIHPKKGSSFTVSASFACVLERCKLIPPANAKHRDLMYSLLIAVIS